jgi:flavorubredoxin
MEVLRGLRFKYKIGAAFGSYGWSGELPRIIEEHFERSSIPVIPGVRCKWQPRAQDLEACRALGRDMAEAIRKGVVSEVTVD